jgi:2',3'-cyclic-nucleotide 2'-phosphodiesterase/3'-nucleotidase
MRQKLFVLIVSLTVSLFLVHPGVAAERITLKFIETTDVHASLFPYDFIEAKKIQNSLAQIYTYVQTERAKSDIGVVLLDAGDILQGQPLANYFNYERGSLDHHIVAEAMNYMAYDAGAVGNHDIEPGKPVYDALKAQFKFPWLAANCIDTTTDKPYFEPYTVIERKGVRIAILGMITPGIPKWLPQSVWSNLRFDDMVKTAHKWVPYILKKEKPDLLVGLFHSGFNYKYGGSDENTPLNENASQLVAKRVPGFDLIFIGHDHKNWAEKVQNELTGETVPVCGADNAAVAFAEAVVTMEKTAVGWQKVDASASTKDVKAYEPDAGFAAAFETAIGATKKYVDEQIGQFKSDTSSRDAMFGDSSFNDLVHKLQFKVAQNVIGQKAEISFAAPLQFNKTIQAGPVFVRDMYKLYKYENTLYLMSLSGKEIDGHLEFSYTLWVNQMKSADDHLLNFKKYEEATGNYDLAARYYNYDSAAGIIYEVDLRKPAGDQVTILGMDADLDGKLDEGSQFDPDGQYKVAINSYRAGGGGGHLTKGAGIAKKELGKRQLGVTARDLRYYLIEAIKTEQTVAPQAIGNWSFLPADWAQAGAEKDRKILYGKSGDGH